ncbi:MAG: hypothetical protein H8E16_01905 [Flavobacteriales bacterium]|nr:hypothetical protein [Flavobacteriales bacterium]
MTLDELLLEWSYRSERGYPSLDNPSDVLLLETILEQLDLPVDEIINNLDEITGLSPGKFRQDANFGPFKGESRIEILVRKLQKDEPLTLIDGSTITVANKEDVIVALRGEFKNAIELIGTDGRKTTTSKLKKTTEFGGKDAVSTDEKTPTVDTDTKESLVILMYNVLKEGGDLKPFTPEDYANNFKIINNSTSKFQDIDDGIKAKINTLFELIGKTKKPLRKARAVLNNPYSIAKEIMETYPNARFNRGDIFDDIRTLAKAITRLPADKWNPGDIYLVNSEVTLPTDTDTIVPLNALFVNNWGDTDAPLVSISLKEEKYQPGRAKSYLDKFGGKTTFNMGKEEMEFTKEQLIEGMRTYRNQVRASIVRMGYKIQEVGDGWNSYPDNDKRIKEKYGAYKLLDYLLSNDNEASLLGLFSYGLSIDQDLRVNPTFFKLIGRDKGTQAKKVKYPAGINTTMAPEEAIIIEDKVSNGNIKITGIIIKTDGSEFNEREETTKTLRGSGKGQVQIT